MADCVGAYEPAIKRHARLAEAPPPTPVNTTGRLSPAFVEWMMTLPPGWVTEARPTENHPVAENRELGTTHSGRDGLQEPSSRVGAVVEFERAPLETVG